MAKNIMCEGSHSIAASQIHLKGAATIMKQRGVSQFSSLVGHGTFVRLRGSIVSERSHICLKLAHFCQLALSLVSSEPFPKYFLQHLKEEGHEADDFEVVFFSLLSRVCNLRAQYKNEGFVSKAMAEDANATLQLLDSWHPEFPAWVMPLGHRSFDQNSSAPGVNMASNVDKAHRFIWVAMSWLLLLTARLLIYDTQIVYYTARQAISPSLDTDSVLQMATTAQIDVAQDTQDAVEYYLETLLSTRATTCSIGAHMLMLPVSILLGLRTTGPKTVSWIANMSSRIAEAFALKQAQMVANSLSKNTQEEKSETGSVTESPAQIDAINLAAYESSSMDKEGVPEDRQKTHSILPLKKDTVF